MTRGCRNNGRRHQRFSRRSRRSSHRLSRIAARRRLRIDDFNADAIRDGAVFLALCFNLAFPAAANAADYAGAVSVYRKAHGL
jgi:hypothetical protein